jgi:hypothetical protein
MPAFCVEVDILNEQRSQKSKSAIYCVACFGIYQAVRNLALIGFCDTAALLGPAECVFP